MSKPPENDEYLIEIECQNPLIVTTGSIDSRGEVRNGWFVLEWHAGACRLLIPDSRKYFLPEILKGKDVLITRGFWPKPKREHAFNLKLIDECYAPFVINLCEEERAQMLIDSDAGKTFPFTVWTCRGQVWRLNGRYRQADRNSCLPPWDVTHLKIAITFY